MTTPTAEQVAAYATDPMAFFADSRIPVEGKPRLGDAWAPFQIEAFRELAKCLLALEVGEMPPYRGAWIERVKGGSKDTDVGLVLTHALLFAGRRVLIEVAADDQDQARETHGAMVDDLAMNPWKAGPLAVQRDKIVNTTTGSECKFLTRDQFGGHGSRPDVTVLAELTHIQSEGFALTVMDNAAKMPSNFTVIQTNAGHLKTWQHDWRERYRANPRWWFQAMTETPPWQSAEDIADAKARCNPSRGRRLFEGEWVTPGGDALPAEALAKAICLPGPICYRDQSDHTICGIGVDAGLTNHHAAVVVLVGSHLRQKLSVAWVEDFPPPVSLARVEEAIVRLANVFCTRFVTLDPWQLMRTAQELETMGYDVECVYPTPQIQMRQAGALLQSVREGILETYDDPLLVDDLYGCRVVEKAYGQRLEFTENEHGHGDRLSALCSILPFALEALGHIPLLTEKSLPKTIWGERIPSYLEV